MLDRSVGEVREFSYLRTRIITLAHLVHIGFSVRPLHLDFYFLLPPELVTLVPAGGARAQNDSLRIAEHHRRCGRARHIKRVRLRLADRRLGKTLAGRSLRKSGRRRHAQRQGR